MILKAAESISDQGAAREKQYADDLAETEFLTGIVSKKGSKKKKALTFQRLLRFKKKGYAEAEIPDRKPKVKKEDEQTYHEESAP